MAEASGFKGWLRRRHDGLGAKVRRGVRAWRRWDAKYLRPVPPPLPGRRLVWQLLAPPDYPFFIPLLTAFLVFGVTVGPRPSAFTPETLCLLAIGLAAMLGLHAAAIRSAHARFHLLTLYMLLLLALGAGLLGLSWAFPETRYDPAEHPLRVHVGPALALILAVMLILAGAAARAVTHRVKDDTMPAALPHVELFQPKNRSDFMGDTPLLAAVAILFLPPLRFPMQLLLPPAMATLLLSPESVWRGSLFMLAVAWALLIFGLLFDRFMEILNTVGRLCFTGPQRILSGLVIAVAAARWADVRYVEYLFDTPAGVWTISFYFLFAYAICWFHGFWCEILLARRFIRLLHPGGAPVTDVDYNYLGPQDTTRVENLGRTIALHGAGRLKVEGAYDPAYRQQERCGEDEKALTFLTPAELMSEFRTQLEDRPWRKRFGPDPLPRVRDLQRAVLAFPGWNALVLLVCLGLPLYAGRFRTAQPPELQIVDPVTSARSLWPLLLEPANMNAAACPALGANTPRIAVAASGGGTRAAIYTYAVLRGLAERGHICRVVLVSGVSGGSAALAYLAAHQDTLVTKPWNEAEWDAFGKAMTKPFIQDVLYAASDNASIFGTWLPRAGVCGEQGTEDPRAAGWRPRRISLGNLLAEDFVCTIGLQTMGEVRFGLILNTGLTGKFLPSPWNKDLEIPAQAYAEKGNRSRASDVAGGRLVFANFASSPRAGDLRYRIFTDSRTSVARAAALTANFPPVFADAAVDVRTTRNDMRFWVTDGGTVENRGTVTLYLAIEDALSDLPPAAKPPTWPDLHVLVADASAVGGPYQEGIGLGALQGAGGQMGLAMEVELRRDLEAAYAGHGRILFHELPMPATLRDAIGTHWMMPNTITAEGWQDREQRLSKDETLNLVASLFTAPGPNQTAAMRTVHAWASFAEPADGMLPAQPLPYLTAWQAFLNPPPQPHQQTAAN